MGHVRGAENVRRRTFWLGAISPPFGLVQRPALAHFNRSDTVDILSITLYSFPRGHIFGDLPPTAVCRGFFGSRPFYQGCAQGPRGGAPALSEGASDGSLVGAPGSGHCRAFCGLLCGKLCFAALDVPFPSSDEFSAVSGHATTFAKMTGLLPCGSQLGVSIARPLQAPVLGSQKSLRFMLLRPRAGCSRWKC